MEATLLVSDDIASPVTFGWRKPVVLLPARFPELDAQRAGGHPLPRNPARAPRRLALHRSGRVGPRGIFWFHPAIWWLLGEIGLAREQEVDRLAIDITKEREQYVDALLAIAGARAQLDLAPAPLFLRKRHLKQRVILIVQEARISKARLISTLTTGLAALIVACWLVTAAFPLTAESQTVNDAAGVTVNLNGSTVLHRSPVQYPAPALQRGVQGAVSVEVKLDAAGNVSDAHVLSGPDELRSAALQSVLEWHFTRDAAGGTRVVQIAFELPQAGVAEGIVGGVHSGVPGGVKGGVAGGVVSGGPANLQAPPSSRRILGIQVMGISNESRSALLATLPVHEGGELTDDALRQTNSAVKRFDEHLWLAQRMSTAGVTLVISTSPASVGLPERIQEDMRRSESAAATSQPTALSASTPPTRIKVGGNVQSVMIVNKVPPVYPQAAKLAGVEGVVRLAATIGKDGAIQELHSLSGPALLIQSAMDAVQQWTYKPTLLNGDPVVVETTIDINFTLTK